MSEIKVSIADIKARISEYIAKSSFNHDRIIITKRDKPVAALVNIDDYHLLQNSGERSGLAEIIGKWKGSEEIAIALQDIHKIRKINSDLRDVSI